MTRFEVLFLDDNDSIQVTDIWAPDGTLDALIVAMSGTIHNSTEIVEIRKMGELMGVE